MLVKELIEKLQKLNPDATVVVENDAGYWGDLKTVREDENDWITLSPTGDDND